MQPLMPSQIIEYKRAMKDFNKMSFIYQKRKLIEITISRGYEVINDLVNFNTLTKKYVRDQFKFLLIEEITN